ncbi:unnamed protein product [Jaminaea pallidilutea]
MANNWTILLQRLLLVLACLHFASEAAAAAAATKPKLLKATTSIPSSWKSLGKAPAKNVMQFSLYLNSPDRSGLAAKMEQISKDPRSPWLTQAQLAPYITPSSDAQKAVVASLTAAGIPAGNISFSGLKDRVIVNTSVSLAQKYFNTTITNYSHEGKDAVPKATNVTLPSTIANSVYSVGTLLAFADYVPSANMMKTFPSAGDVQPKRTTTKRRADDLDEEATLVARQTSSSTPPSSCVSSGNHYYNYPKCLIDIYGLPQPKKSLRRRNDLAVVGYLGENMSQNDLTRALSLFRSDQPNAAAYKMTVTDLYGASTNGSNPTGEAALDAQIIASLTYPLQTTFYNIGDSSGNTIGADVGDIFLTSLQMFIEMDASTRPSVVAISYGILDESGMTATANAMCNAAQVLSALGTTVVLASGDTGPDSVARAASPNYPDNSGYCPALRSGYPAGCPYILSVGATGGYGSSEQPAYYGMPSGLSGASWPFASGAGFSKLWSTPDYQASGLSSWATNPNKLWTNATAGQYTSSGRAFPDIMALGIDYPIIMNNNAYLQAGTSMSAPVVGSIIALLNDLLLNAGKATAGWVQPMFYANPSAFTDHQIGGAWWKCGAGTEQTAQAYGFSCTPGWDAASGLGSPNFAKLRALYGV